MTAEAQGKLVIAKRFPRNEAQAYAGVREACKSLSFAEVSSFSYNRGGSKVTGPTIRLAELCARHWGNIEFGLRELSQRPGETEMEAYAWDVERNVVTRQGFVVKHLRDKSGGATKLTQQRDIYEVAANMGARRLRARIMAILPPDFVEAAEQCRKTLENGGQGEIPLAKRIDALVERFASIGVSVKMLEDRLEHPLADSLPAEFADLQQIFRSIKDGYTEAHEWFGKDKNARKQLDALAGDKDPAGGAEPEQAEAPPASDSDGEDCF